MAVSGRFRDTIREGGSSWAQEFGRRLALAREPRPNGVRGPRPALAWGELRSLALPSPRLTDIAPARRPQPVMLLPGFGTHPVRMAKMRRALNAAGHRVTDWGLGFNLGPSQENFAFLLERIGQTARRHGMPVALVGWSLGGLFAREAAKQRPRAVSRVITMGTPFSGNLRANNAWRAYQFITGHSVDEPPIPGDYAMKPPVPTVALWSPLDGVIAPRSACGRKGERDRAVSVRCCHLAFPSDPLAIAEVLRQLDRHD